MAFTKENIEFRRYLCQIKWIELPVFRLLECHHLDEHCPGREVSRGDGVVEVPDNNNINLNDHGGSLSSWWHSRGRSWPSRQPPAWWRCGCPGLTCNGTYSRQPRRQRSPFWRCENRSWNIRLVLRGGMTSILFTYPFINRYPIGVPRSEKRKETLKTFNDNSESAFYFAPDVLSSASKRWNPRTCPGPWDVSPGSFFECGWSLEIEWGL